MELKRELDICPNCEKSITAKYTYCPFCGKKIPEYETVPLENVILIKTFYEKPDSLADLNKPLSNTGNYILYKPQKTQHDSKYFVNTKTSSIHLTVAELESYLAERKDNFVELDTDPLLNKKIRISKFYINKAYPITEFSIEYDISVDQEGCVDSFCIDIGLDNKEQDIHINLNDEVNVFYGTNTDSVCDSLYIRNLTSVLYNIMKAFAILPKYKSPSDIHYDFLPYAIRKAIDDAIDLYKTNYPDEYNALQLRKEMED